MSRRDTPAAPCLRRDLELVSVSGTVFLFDRGPRRLHRLNSTAAVVVEELDGTSTVDEIVATLTGRFGVTADQIHTDTGALIDRLEAEGLLAGAAIPPRAVAAPVRGLERATTVRSRRLDQLLEAHSWVRTSGPYEAFDFTFRVQADDPDVADHLESVLASLAPSDMGSPRHDPVRTYRIAQPAGNHPWRVWLDTTRLVAPQTAIRAVDHVLWHVNRMAVLSSPENTVLHAAAAVAPSGAILLPAVGNAGKSTLVTGLVRAGLGYLSDEAVLYAASGELRPYPKAISLDRGTWPLVPDLAPDDPAGLQQSRWHVPPDRVRPGCVATAAPPRWLVSPQYQPGAVAHLEPLADEEAFELLLEQSFHLGTATGALDLLARLVETVPCHRLVAGDLDGAVATALELIGAPSRS